jgi:hypothetical protein
MDVVNGLPKLSITGRFGFDPAASSFTMTPTGGAPALGMGLVGGGGQSGGDMGMGMGMTTTPGSSSSLFGLHDGMT